MGAPLAQQLAALGLERALILVSPAPRAGILPSSDSEKDLSQSLMRIPSFWKTVINPDFDLACFYSLICVPKDGQRAVFDKFGPESGLAYFQMFCWMFNERRPPRWIRVRCVARCSAFPAPMTILCRLAPRAPQPCHIAMRNSGRRLDTGTCFRRTRRRRHRPTDRRLDSNLTAHHLLLIRPERQRHLMQPIISVEDLSKTYASGYEALKSVNLEIRKGEIFALLGPNGAGKTTLINIVCGIVTPSSGKVLVGGHDILTDYRATRSMIGLVPQELTTDAFETVWATVSFSRGLFGKRDDPAHIEKVLKQLSLWDRRHSKIMTLSGGMKRRVLIAKALSHEPQVLFLDEPTAGVDVELRQDMWQVVRDLRASGVTIILTTHYIEEAEDMADRIGVISKGEIILIENKAELMHKLGKKQLTLQLPQQLDSLPPSLPGIILRSRRTATSWSTPTIPKASAPASPVCCRTSMPPACGSRICRRRKARSRTSSSIW